MVSLDRLIKKGIIHIMELSDIRCVLAVAYEKNFTRAAESLFITQSALSQKISRIEKQLGVKLFIRTNRSVALTEACQVFVENGLPVIEACDNFNHAMEKLQTGQKESLSLAFFPLAEYSEIPQITAGFITRYPEYQLSISTISHESKDLEALKNGHFDFAFQRLLKEFLPADISAISLTQEPMFILLHKEDALASNQHIFLSDIRHYHIITAKGAMLVPSADFPYHELYSDNSSLPSLITGPGYCTLTTESTCHKIIEKYSYLTALPFEDVLIDLFLCYSADFKNVKKHPFYQHVMEYFHLDM